MLIQNLSKNARVIRVMPNTPALVQSGCSVYVRGTRATDNDARVTQSLLEAIGTCEEVPEHFLDPVTALSGSGPAYVFVMIEALADGAVRMGLPRDLAYRLASQTVMGSGHLVRDSKEHPGQLKDNVTSPAGSTAAGLKHLEESGTHFYIRENQYIKSFFFLKQNIFCRFSCSSCRSCRSGYFKMPSDFRKVIHPKCTYLETKQIFVKIM